MRIKGEVLHKGNIVPVEVEIGVGWLGGDKEIIIHIPEEYRGTPNLIHMIDFKADLKEKIQPYIPEKKYKCIANCNELDINNEPHCTCNKPTIECPCGNTPNWKETEEK